MPHDLSEFPRLIISALRGGSGKTILSIGIIAALKNRRLQVAPFKKGPDYIDAGWLALAAGRPCYNLDTFMIPPKQVYTSFTSRFTPNDIAIIEGNRGLYDGIDISGSTSTAELAKMLKSPVILCLDATKTTRTMAAVVAGCDQFDPAVQIKGVILNRVAGMRHETILRDSIETHCQIPVLGAVPKLGRQILPERHMGLVPTPEHDWAQDSIHNICKIAEQYIDIDALVAVVTEAPALSRVAHRYEWAGSKTVPDDAAEKNRPRIGIIKDSAFQFYYPENIDALAAAGAEVTFLSPLETQTIPAVDALYIGGGFPETHAEALASNVAFKTQLKKLAEGGLPIYAECGGLMYLGQQLEYEGNTYPMAGVLPIIYGFSKKPQGHGYTIAKVDRKNPFYAIGTELFGHEFHYSRVLEWHEEEADLVFGMKRGNGIIHQRDGACYKNVLATYTHIHALGTTSWAESMVSKAKAYHQHTRQRQSKSPER